MGELMLVEEVNGQEVVSSKVIAENVNRKHKNIKETIEKYIEKIEDFGKVPFQTEALPSGQKEKFYYLNEEQSTFLLTLLKNSEVVVEFKLNLVKAFTALKKQHLQQERLETLEQPAKLFQNLANVASLFGLSKNASLISANTATRKITGVDFQETLGIELKSEDNQQLMTPTTIGKELGMSNRKVNIMLIENDYQGKNESGYYPLKKGEPFAVMIDSTKKHSDGSMIQQLKWKQSILEELKEVK